MVEDVVSESQFRAAKTMPDLASPERPTMQPGEHFGSQFAGLTAGVPEVKAARHPHYIDGVTVHQWRTSPGNP
jgi:hypothetical protein